MYLFVPDIHSTEGEHSGYGHLIRVLRIAVSIGGEILLDLVQQKLAYEILQKFFKQFPHAVDVINIVSEPSGVYDAIIIDKREISLEFAKNFIAYGFTIGIDVGGEGRNTLGYLIDTLPNLLTDAPNTYVPYASLSQDISIKKSWSSSCKEIFYYTNEEPNEHEFRFLEKVLLCRRASITLISSYHRSYKEIQDSYSNFQVLDLDLQIINCIQKYDLFITHFGISAFESISAKVPVVLFNKSEYQNRLSKHANFPHIYSFTDSVFITNSKKSTKQQSDVLDGYSALADYLINVINDDLLYADLIQSMTLIKDYDLLITSQALPHLDEKITQLAQRFKSSHNQLLINPWLGLTQGSSVYRDEKKSVFQCRDTFQYYQQAFTDKLPVYNKKYFMTDYKEVYGSTYIEDYTRILSLMRRRMQYIQKLLPKHRRTIERTDVNNITGKKIIYYLQSPNSPVLCDLGSAYGAMLQSTAEFGYRELGIDINRHAVTYCRKVLNKNAIVGNLNAHFLRSLLKKSKINPEEILVFTSFLLLEHLPNIQFLLDEIHQILPVGGLFVCSVTNADGYTAKKNSEQFFHNIPNNQYGIFTPKGISKILENAGFKIKKIYVDDYPPISKLFGQSDVFEVYAQKFW